MDARYPIGKFTFPQNITDTDRARWIDEIETAPARFREAVTGLSEEQLETPYREGGWTVRQVVHHVADSHMMAYGRWKLALTADEPTVWAYDEAKWAQMVDARTAPVEVSLALLESLHRRWVMLLRAMMPADYERTYRHPELGVVNLGGVLALYAWHGRHHVAHILGARSAVGA